MSRKNKTQSSQVRLISGKWRGRKIAFLDTISGLRPTPDRVRETVFNWLLQDIKGATCLDVCTGSGALGFEALSRGAKQVTMLEKKLPVFKQLQATQKQLDAQDAVLINTDALVWLNTAVEPFDIIFVDPPYGANILEKLLQIVEKRQLLKPEGIVYFEHNAEINASMIPEGWEILRQRRAGNIYFYLAKAI